MLILPGKVVVGHGMNKYFNYLGGILNILAEALLIVVNTLTLEKHFLSCVNNTAFPEPGLHTRAISLRQEG